MTFEEVKKRPDYHFKQRIGRIRDQLAKGKIEDMDADSEPMIGMAVLEIGYVDIELNISIRAMFDDSDLNDKTSVPEYYCCIKYGDEECDWDCLGYLSDESKFDERAKVKVDWSAENWLEQLENDMCETLIWFADLKGFSFDHPNDLLAPEEGKEPRAKEAAPTLTGKEYCIRAAKEISHDAWGWNLAIEKDIAIFNKTRILAELESAENGIKEIREYIRRLEETK